jgi:hypothetical protein
VVWHSLLFMELRMSFSWSRKIEHV